MREKMRDHFSARREATDFHLKQRPGGIVDLEFMVQYAVLAGAAQQPSLAEWPDNVRILESLARSGRLAREQCRALSDAYLALRSASHRCALQQRPPVLPAQRFAALRGAIRAAWEQMFSSSAPRSTAKGTARGTAGDAANADEGPAPPCPDQRTGSAAGTSASEECAKPDGGHQH